MKTMETSSFRLCDASMAKSQTGYGWNKAAAREQPTSRTGGDG